MELEKNLQSHHASIEALKEDAYSLKKSFGDCMKISVENKASISKISTSVVTGTPWLELPMAQGIPENAQGRYMQYSSGLITFFLSAQAKDAFFQIATFPYGFRPSKELHIPTFGINASGVQCPVDVTIHESGLVCVNTSPGVHFSLTASFLANI